MGNEITQSNCPRILFKESLKFSKSTNGGPSRRTIAMTDKSTSIATTKKNKFGLSACLRGRDLVKTITLLREED